MNRLLLWGLAVLTAMPVLFAPAESVAAPKRAAGNTYYFKNSMAGGEADLVVRYGRAEDEVFVGDWNGDGIDTLAVRRGNRFIVNNSVSGGEVPVEFTFGRPGDEIHVGDWDGDGFDTFAVRRGNRFELRRDLVGAAGTDTIHYGRRGDSVVVGDWDGDGTDTITVRRGNAYFIVNSNRSGWADRVVNYGRAADGVLVGDWDSDGTDSLAVVRGVRFYVRNELTSGIADYEFVYGRAGDQVFLGDWDGNGTDTFMVRRNDNAQPTLPENNQHPGMKAPPEIQRNTASEPPADLGFPVGDGDEIGPGWAVNSVNATAFSKTPIVTSARTDSGDEIQTVAYYDPQANLVIARKNLTRGTEWERHITQYSGQVLDGHNSISIAVDGDGYLHVSWGMHGQPMQYARSLEPWSMYLGPIEPLTGLQENQVTYPEFHQQANGNLYMLYRSGLSGDGNLVVNHYDTSARQWTQVQSNLIDGRSQGKSPYWQAAVDSQDRLHVAWNWRTTPDIYTNHDFMYARSVDATGSAWETSTGETYSTPITAEQAELIVAIPEGSELMNQTAMAIDDADNPFVVSYWRPEPDEPIQYMVMYLDEGEWTVHNTRLRQTDFTHYTSGSKLAIMGRPKILVTGSGADAIVHLIVRDRDFYGSAATLLSSRVGSEQWSSLALTDDSLRYWEPVFDIARWQRFGQLDILVARTGGIRSTPGNYPVENFYVLRVPQDYLNGIALTPPDSASEDEDGEDGAGDHPGTEGDVGVPTAPPAEEHAEGDGEVEGEGEEGPDSDVLPAEPAEEGTDDGGELDVTEPEARRGDEREGEIPGTEGERG